jgi:uncharacterized protein YycO
MEKGDILCCYGRTWIDKLIGRVQNSNITHIAICIEDGFVMESSWLGVKLTKKESIPSNYDVYTCDRLSPSQRDRISDFVKQQTDVPYDYKLLFGVFLHRYLGLPIHWDDPHKYICIELAIEAYRQVVNLELLAGIPDEDIVPADIPRSKYLKFKEQVKVP